MTIRDWTFSETISPPRVITVEYANLETGEKSSVSLTSTATSKTETVFQEYPLLRQVFDEIGENGAVTVRTVIEIDEAVSSTSQENRSTQAAVNTAYVADRLSRGRGLPAGDANTLIETFNTYRDGGEGVGIQIVEKVENTYISEVQFAGSLPIPSYEFYEPGVGLIQSQKRVTKYFYARSREGREYTKTETSTWMALALSQEGSQGTREQFKQLLEVAAGFEGEEQASSISSIVRNSAELIFEGTEVQTSIGRTPPPIKPPNEDILRDEVLNGIPDSNTPGQPSQPVTSSPDNWQGWDNDYNLDTIPDWADFVPGPWQDFDQDSDDDGVPDWAPFVPDDNRFTPGPGGPSAGGPTFGGGTGGTGAALPATDPELKYIRGIVRFQGFIYDAADNTTTATYEMPFAPDDVFEWVNGVRRLIPGGARAAAREFGRISSRLELGHAFGQNIVTGWNEMPSADLAPVYVRINGIQGAFLADSTSYAWDGSGMVVSSDLMLLGANGYYGDSPPTTSWLRLPILTTELSQVD